MKTLFVGYYEDSLAKIESMGLSPAQIEELQEYGLLATDNVTGFHEGRSGNGRISTLKRAISHVKQTGDRAFYVEIDLQNLSGMNAALGHSGANKVYRKIAEIIREEFSATAGTATFFRHGGDEMSIFLIDTGEEAIETAMTMVDLRVVMLAKKQGLDNIPHTKRGNNAKGIGVYFGVCELTEHHRKNLSLVFTEADKSLEADKRRRAKIS